jgi:imidazolonepropionase-like amidohydrolase
MATFAGARSFAPCSSAVSIASVIAAATTTPAKTIGWGDRIGSLEPGMAADIAVLELQACHGVARGDEEGFCRPDFFLPVECS